MISWSVCYFSWAEKSSYLDRFDYDKSFCFFTTSGEHTLSTARKGGGGMASSSADQKRTVWLDLLPAASV
jgi:hypothetical protein